MRGECQQAGFRVVACTNLLRWCSAGPATRYCESQTLCTCQASERGVTHTHMHTMVTLLNTHEHTKEASVCVGTHGDAVNDGADLLSGCEVLLPDGKCHQEDPVRDL